MGPLDFRCIQIMEAIVLETNLYSMWVVATICAEMIRGLVLGAAAIPPSSKHIAIDYRRQSDWYMIAQPFSPLRCFVGLGAPNPEPCPYASEAV